MKTISSFCWNLLLNQFKEEFGREVTIYNNNFDGESIELGVNWASIGIVSAEEAQEFARKITRAASIAAHHPVNGARIVYAPIQTRRSNERE